MKKVLKRERGITLVALVITVAIILILTNVVIYNAADSIRSTKLQNMQADIENLRDKVSNYYSQYGMIPANTNIEYTNTSNINSISQATDTGPFYVIDLAAMENVTLNYGKDYEKIRNGEATTQEQINKLTDLYIINADSHNIFYVAGIEIDGEIFYTDYSAEDADKVAVEIHLDDTQEPEEPNEPEEPPAEVILAKDIPASDYGATVNGYDCENSAGVNAWKIFYADDSNIYLIAGDYIPYNYIPSNSKGHKPNQVANSNYKAYFTNVIGDYTGSASITDSRLKALNNDFFNVKKYTSTNYNMKSVAYMLDTNAWSVYKGSKADYAIGGPTVELLFNSYNKKYGKNYKAQASSSKGYQISNNGGSSWSDSISGMLDKSDSTYVINSRSNAYGMWVASPSAYGSGPAYVMGVGYYGGVSDAGYTYSSDGFRPLVCLNSSVQLQKNADGSYTIK